MELAWIKGNRSLTLAEMQNNASIIYERFTKKGWTLNAIAAMLGNMQTESWINPWVWEGFQQNNNNGYGLVQWTPATKYINWAGADWQNPEKEIERIQYEVDNNLQWGANAAIGNPPITFQEFTISMLPVETLANYFLWYYERPFDPHQPNRATQARYWYDYLLNNPIPSGSIPTWLLFQLTKRRY